MEKEKTSLSEKVKSAARAVGLTPGPNAPAVDAGARVDEMPRTLGALARDYGAGGGGSVPLGGGGAPAPASGAEAGAADASSPLARKVLGNLSGFPFALAALKTGNAHWNLKDDENALLSEAAEGVAESYGVGLSAKANPWSCLILGVVGFGLPRLVEEMRLMRLALEKDKAKPE